MYSPELIRLKADASQKLDTFLQAFNIYYFRAIIDDKIKRNFIEEIITFHAISDEGVIFDKAIAAIDLYRLDHPSAN